MLVMLQIMQRIVAGPVAFTGRCRHSYGSPCFYPWPGVVGGMAYTILPPVMSGYRKHQPWSFQWIGKAAASGVFGSVAWQKSAMLSLLPEQTHNVLRHFLMHLLVPFLLLQPLLSPFLVLLPDLGHLAPPSPVFMISSCLRTGGSHRTSFQVLFFLCVKQKG